MKIDLLGVKIDNLTKAEVLQAIETELDPSTSFRTGKPVFIVTPYSESIVAAQKDAEFRNILNSADIALPDGVGVLWAANFLKFGGLFRSLFSILSNPSSLCDPIPEKISGSDFIWGLAELAAKNNFSIFLLGGFDDTPSIVAEKLKLRFPNLNIAGTLSPPSPDEGTGRGGVLIEQINSSHPDFLFVALGPVKQEKWIYQNLPNLSVKLAIGLGGTFDYIAGKRLSAPRFLRVAGLEWLWRLATQPWRVWRILRGIIGLIWYSWSAKV